MKDSNDKFKYKRRLTLHNAKKYYLTNGQGSHNFYIYYNSTEEGDRLEREHKEKQRELNRQFKEDMQKRHIQPDRLLTMNDNLNRPEWLITLEPDYSIDIQLDEGTGNTLLILGQSKAGKSVLMMYLYNKYYKNPKFISTLFSINKNIGVYKSGGKDLIKVPVFDNDGKMLIKMSKYINSNTDNAYSFLYMFDDIVDQKDKQIIADLFLTYRNANISTIMSLQYGYLLSKKSRANVNNICLFRFVSQESVEVIVKTYLRGWFLKLGIRNLDEQVELYNKLTNDYRFLYLNPRTGDVTLHKVKYKG